MKVKKLPHTSASFGAGHCGPLLDASPEGLLFKGRGPVAGFQTASSADVKQVRWPCLADQQDLLMEEGRLAQAQVRSLGAHRPAGPAVHTPVTP